MSFLQMNDNAVQEESEQMKSPQSSDKSREASKLRIKPLLPEITKDTSSLVFGLNYQELHSSMFYYYLFCLFGKENE